MYKILLIVIFIYIRKRHFRTLCLILRYIRRMWVKKKEMSSSPCLMLLVKIKDKSEDNILAWVALLENNNSFTFAVFIHVIFYIFLHL